MQQKKTSHAPDVMPGQTAPAKGLFGCLWCLSKGLYTWELSCNKQKEVSAAPYGSLTRTRMNARMHESMNSTLFVLRVCFFARPCLNVSRHQAPVSLSLICICTPCSNIDFPARVLVQLHLGNSARVPDCKGSCWNRSVDHGPFSARQSSSSSSSSSSSGGSGGTSPLASASFFSCSYLNVWSQLAQTNA